MKIKIYYFFIIFFAFYEITLAQTDTLNLYDIIYLNQQIENRKDQINSLYQKITFYQNQFYQTKAQLKKIEITKFAYNSILKNLLKIYYIQKLSSINSNIFLYSSPTQNNFFSRLNNIKFLIKYTKKVYNYLQLLNQQYDNKIQLLQTYQNALNQYLNNYQSNKKLLDQNLEMYNNQILFLKQNEQKIRSLLEKEIIDYNQMQSIISKYLTTNNISQFSEKPKVLFTSPLNNSFIISSFGEHDHPVYQNIKIKNDGIDITSKTDTIVKAIDNATVVAIIKLKKYGYSIILKHNNNYYSVYSNLNLIFVTQNQNITQNTPIGTISKSTSKYTFPCLNIQIWYNTNKLNPIEYLNL